MRCDIARFPSTDVLAAYPGFAPHHCQSAQLTASNIHLAKREAPQLSYIFYRAALVSIRHNPDLATCYRVKVRQGKPKKKAIMAAAHKLIRIVCSLRKSQKHLHQNSGKAERQNCLMPVSEQERMPFSEPLDK